MFGRRETTVTAMVPIDDPDRSTQEAVLDEMLLKIQIDLNQRGYGTKEILTALDSVCEKRWRAYEQDPDPADDS
jgi:hypothetical protein